MPVQSDVLLHVGLDTSKLNAQLAKLRSQLGIGLGKTLTQPMNQAGAAAQNLGKNLKSPIGALQALNTQTGRLSNTQKSSIQRSRELIRESNLLGASKQNLTQRLRILNRLYGQGIISQKQLAGAAGAVKDRMADLGKVTGGLIGKFTTMLKTTALWAVGWNLMYGAIRAVTSTLRLGVSGFVNLESAMARIATVTTTTNRSLRETTKIQRDLILATANRLPTSLDATSEALFKLSTASLDAYEASVALTPVMELTAATAKDLSNQTELAGSTAKIVAGIYNTYGDALGASLSPAEKFAKISQVLFKTFSKQQVELDELTQGLQFSVGAASQAGIPFEELAAILGVLNTQMQKSGRAGRGFQRSMSVMLKDTEKLSRQFGIAFDPEKPINFLEVIRQIRTQIVAQGGSVESLGGTYDTFGLRGAPNLLGIIQGFDKLEEQIALNKSSVDLLGNAVALRTNTIQGQFLLLKNTWQTTAASFLETFGGTIQDVLISLRVILIGIKTDLLIVNGILEIAGDGWKKLGILGYAGLLKIKQGIAEFKGQDFKADFIGLVIEKELAKIKDKDYSQVFADIVNQIQMDSVSITQLLKDGLVVDNKLLSKMGDEEERINSEHKTRIGELNEEHRLRMLEISGLGKQKLLMEEIAWVQANVIDQRAREMQVLKLENELVEEQLQAWMDIVNVVKDELAGGIQGILSGTGSLTDMLTTISDKFVKMALDQIVQEIVMQPVLDTAVATFGSHVQTFDAAVNRMSGGVGGGGGGGGGAGGAMGMAAGGIGLLGTVGAAFKKSPKAAMELPGGGFADASGKAIPKKLHGAGSLGGNALGALGVASAGYGAYQAGVAGGPAKGAISGILGGAMAGAMFGPVGAVIGGAIGGIAGLIGGMKTTKTTDIQEQTDTIKISSKIDITNRELKILNRNMVGLRRGFEGWVMQQSFYLRQRPTTGAQDQPFSFAVNAKRGYQ